MTIKIQRLDIREVTITADDFPRVFSALFVEDDDPAAFSHYDYSPVLKFERGEYTASEFLSIEDDGKLEASSYYNGIIYWEDDGYIWARYGTERQFGAFIRATFRAFSDDPILAAFAELAG